MNQFKTDIDHIIEHVSKAYNVAPELIKAVIKIEGDFDPTVLRPKGQRGSCS